MAIIYGLKVNLSVAMVAMLNHSGIALQQLNNTGGHIIAGQLTKLLNSSLLPVVDEDVCESGDNAAKPAPEVNKYFG